VRWPVRVLTLLVPLRIALDLSWGVDVGALSFPQLGHAAIGIALAALVAMRCRSLRGWPLFGPAALLGVALCVGIARAGSLFDAARYGLLLASPVAFLAALHLWWDDRPAPPAWTWTAAAPIAWSLVALIAGQPAGHVVNDVPRLVGGYSNPHTHAITLAVAAVAGVGFARRAPIAWIVVAGAGICVLAGFVRSAYLLLLVALVAGAVLERRPGRALGIVVGLGAILALAGSLHDRWADLGAILSGTPPADGWRALGSSRVHIWSASLAAFFGGAPADVWLGRGLGGHFGLHRHLDPHSDVLAVLFQLGPLGVIAYGWLIARALVELIRTRTVDAAHAAGLLLALVVAGTVSNDGLSRATAALWTAGLAGIAARGRASRAGGATPTPRAA